MSIPTKRVKHNDHLIVLFRRGEATVHADAESGQAAVVHFNAWVKANEHNIYVHTGNGDMPLKSMSVKWEELK